MTNTVIVLAIALFFSSAYAADLPEMKEGLWSVHTQSTNDPGGKKSEGNYTICRNHAFDKKVEAGVKNIKGCSMVNENLQGGKYSSEMKCAVAGITIDSKGTTTFQGDTSFHAEVHATNIPPQNGVAATTMITDQKYVGSCPAGAQPGDRTNADGTVMHVGKR